MLFTTRPHCAGAPATPRRPPPRRRAPRRHPSSPPLRASASNWAAACSFDPATDPDYAAHVADLATRLARAALAADAAALEPGSAWFSEVSALGAAAVDAGAMDAARFAFCLMEVGSQRWPNAADGLPPPYGAALEKLHGILEDSGWRLVREEDKGNGTEGVSEDWG